MKCVPIHQTAASGGIEILFSLHDLIHTAFQHIGKLKAVMLVLTGWRPAFNLRTVHLKLRLRCADDQCTGAGLGWMYRHQHQEKGDEDFLTKHIALRIMVERHNLVKAFGSPELNRIYKNRHLIPPPR